MSNPTEGDNGHVAINIEDSKAVGNDAEAKPAAATPVAPIVPPVVNRSEKERRPPKSNSNARSRQLKPGDGGAGNRSRSNSVSFFLPNKFLSWGTDRIAKLMLVTVGE